MDFIPVLLQNSKAFPCIYLCILFVLLKNKPKSQNHSTAEVTNYHLAPE